LDGKSGARAQQRQLTKGQESSADPEGCKAKTGQASSGRCLARSVDKGFFAYDICRVVKGYTRRTMYETVKIIRITKHATGHHGVLRCKRGLNFIV